MRRQMTKLIDRIKKANRDAFKSRAVTIEVLTENNLRREIVLRRGY